LEDYAVIVVSDHSQAPVEERIHLDRALAGFDVATQSAARSVDAEVALSPAQRAAMVYALDEERRDEILARSVEAACKLEGMDLAMWLTGPARNEAVVRSRRGELRFAPGEDVIDDRGESWDVEGELAALRGEVQDGRFLCSEYPDALARIWSALNCPNSGDILLSASPGYEFVDWGGADHVGGGSHGSLHRTDSLGALLWCGTGPASASVRGRWSLRDVAPLVREHFGISDGTSGLGGQRKSQLGAD
jgi:hypothetical protein